jgi:YesN/AraC family two-component response regulator
MAKEGIDLLLTDVIMPDMNGRELADRMELIMPSMKILFMSGYTEDTIAYHGITDIKKRFLQKPLTPRKVAASIREVLDRG